MKRVALVTGSNKGIGYAIVRKLAQDTNFEVILTSRDLGRARAAQQKLADEDHVQVKYHQLDITDDSSIASLAEHVKKEYGGLDVLVNNAGMAFKGDAFDENVARITVGMNFFGTLSVCRQFLPLMRTNGRVVNVSSAVARASLLSTELRQQFLDDRLTVEKLCELENKFITDVATRDWKNCGWPTSTYAVAKIGLNVLTTVLARGESGRGVLITSCNPGWVRTDMAGPRAPLSPEQGAETPVFLALLPEGAVNSHGKYFDNKREVDWTKL